jgi:hypothetical protein
MMALLSSETSKRASGAQPMIALLSLLNFNTQKKLCQTRGSPIKFRVTRTACTTRDRGGWLSQSLNGAVNEAK